MYTSQKYPLSCVKMAGGLFWRARPPICLCNSRHPHSTLRWQMLKTPTACIRLVLDRSQTASIALQREAFRPFQNSLFAGHSIDHGGICFRSAEEEEAAPRSSSHSYRVDCSLFPSHLAFFLYLPLRPRFWFLLYLLFWIFLYATHSPVLQEGQNRRPGISLTILIFSRFFLPSIIFSHLREDIGTDWPAYGALHSEMIGRSLPV